MIDESSKSTQQRWNNIHQVAIESQEVRRRGLQSLFCALLSKRNFYLIGLSQPEQDLRMPSRTRARKNLNQVSATNTAGSTFQDNNDSQQQEVEASAPPPEQEEMPSLEEEEQSRLQRTLKELYRDGKGIEECKSVARDVRCAVRDHLVSKVKFVDVTNKKTFPSFTHHDFTDKKHYLTKFVDDHLNYEMETIESKAAFWITYAKTVKKEVANHRATCAAAIKDAFLRGMLCRFVVDMKTNTINRRALTQIVTSYPPKEYKSTDQENLPKELDQIIKIAEEKNVDTMRQRLDTADAFRLYAEIFLKNTIRKRDWRLKHTRQNLRGFVTVADESLALIILENNVIEWIHEATEGAEYIMTPPPPAVVNVEQQEKGYTEESSLDGAASRSSSDTSNPRTRTTTNKRNKKRKKTRTLYTHGGINADGTKKGWTIEGIKRYNVIMRKTKGYRLDERYTGMEEEVKNRWRDENRKLITSLNERVQEGNGEDEEAEEPLTEFDM